MAFQPTILFTLLLCFSLTPRGSIAHSVAPVSAFFAAAVQHPVAGGLALAHSPARYTGLAYLQDWCLHNGFVHAGPTAPKCSASGGTCGCHKDSCWHSCGDEPYGDDNRHGDWCWTSYVEGKKNYLTCEDDDDCSGYTNYCAGKCS